MKYTEALEEIYKDNKKVFSAYSWGGLDTYYLSGSDLYINTTLYDLDTPVSFLSYRMMELDWTEVKS